MRHPEAALAVFAVLSCGGEDLRQTAPKMELEKTSLDFGPVKELERRELSLQVTNQGRSLLRVNPFVDGSGDFGLVSWPEPLPPAASGMLRVVFVPVGAGSDFATLVVESNDPENQRVEVQLSGGPIDPELTFTPDLLSFVPATQAVEKRLVALRSTGLARVTVNALAFASGSNPDFALTRPLLPLVLDAGAVVDLEITYTRSVRQGGAVLEAQSDDPAGAKRLRLFPDPLTHECEDTDPPRACWPGAAEARGKGRCRDGQQTCSGGFYGECTGAVLPLGEEICSNSTDDDCDSATDEQPCSGSPGCAFTPSAAADAQEPNNAIGSAPVTNTAAGVQTYTYEITLPPGDEDFFRYNIPASGSQTRARAAITCTGWAAAGCGAAPVVGLELLYQDELREQLGLGPGQDGYHSGQGQLAVVQNSGPIDPNYAPQRWYVRAFASNVCAGEAANAQLEVTITNN